MIVITGASSGIGEATAKIFASHKHDLILLARREDRLNALKKSLESDHGVKVSVFPLDVRDNGAIQNLVAKHHSLFSKTEILVNNAGLARGRGPIQDGKPEDWDVVLDTNVKGLLYMTHAILPFMIERKRGHIVNMGSVAGQWMYPDGNLYATSKFAVRALTQAMRMDLLGKGIRVTEIAPGMVETEFSEVRFNDKQKAKAVYAGMTPLTATDIADAVYWAVTRPAHVNIQEIVMFPTAQASVTHVHRT